MKTQETQNNFDTTVFKTMKDLPSSTYPYEPSKGENVGKANGLPQDSYSYKGDKVGSANGVPTSNYSYKGDSVGKAAK